MRLFVFKILIFCLLLFSGVFIISQLELKQKGHNNDYFSAILDKDELLAQTPSPKIILVGGSNLAFSIDSKLIEDSLRMPVVNMGLHADVGLDFMLNHVVPHVNQGDVVFLSLEYYINKPNIEVLKSILNVFPKGEEFVAEQKKSINQIKLYRDYKQHFEQLNSFEPEKLLHQEGGEQAQGIYRRDGFNVNGDNLTHLGEPGSDYLIGRRKRELKPFDGIEKLNSFYKKVLSHKANVYYFFPPQPESEWKVNQKVYEAYEEQLRNEMKIPVLSHVEDYIFPDSLFFDSVYHLKAQGRRKRTEKLIGQYNSWIKVQ